MNRPKPKWEYTEIDLDTQDSNNNKITLHNVPAQRNTETGEIRVKSQDVLCTGVNDTIQKSGVEEERDVWLLLLLKAKPGPFQPGYISEKYRMNKMLFYSWQDMEKEGFSKIIDHDEFEADTRGPVPVSLYDDLERLDEAGVIRVKGGKGEKKTCEVNLTTKGEKMASILWKGLPESYTKVAMKYKVKLFQMTPEAIKNKVHSDYPEYASSYDQLDN